MSGLTDAELKGLLIEAMIQNARHPDFVDYSGMPDFSCDNYQMWWDTDAESIFHEAMTELWNRYEVIELPDGEVIRTCE
jgi:hypothetical protein